MVSSMPCVNTTVRARCPDALGILEIFIAISATSRVSQPSVSAKVTASDSLPNRMSTYGSTSIIAVLNGGTCIRNGADRLNM